MVRNLYSSLEPLSIFGVLSNETSLFHRFSGFSKSFGYFVPSEVRNLLYTQQNLPRLQYQFEMDSE